MRRLKEEMHARGLSSNALARLCKDRKLDVGYATISRILSGKQDPTLQKVDALAEAIGLPAWAMMTGADQLEQVVIKPPQNVVRLPAPYPKIFTTGKTPDTQTRQKTKKRR